MVEEPRPMSPDMLRRLMEDRSLRALLQQRRNERRADRSRMGLAIALVIAERKARTESQLADQILGEQGW